MFYLCFVLLGEEGKGSPKEYPQELSCNKSEQGCFYILFIFAKSYLDYHST